MDWKQEGSPIQNPILMSSPDVTMLISLWLVLISTTLVTIIYFCALFCFQPVAKTIVMMQVKKLFLVNQTYSCYISTMILACNSLLIVENSNYLW